MTADQQQRLTSNVVRDGGLTSLPLVWLMQSEDGTPTADPAVYEIVSGNHRVTSAREAGLEEIDVIVITNWVSAARRVEVQLAHNAVGGQDDLSVLEQLYEGLDLDGKQYSGLTDDAFKGLSAISLTGFNVDGPDYQEIILTFLPEDATQFLELIERVKKTAKAVHHVAHLEDFDAMFDAIVRTKEQLNIQNNAVAIGTMAELAIERLQQMVEEANGPQKDVSPTGDDTDIDVIEAPEGEIPTQEGASPSSPSVAKET